MRRDEGAAGANDCSGTLSVTPPKPAPLDDVLERLRLALGEQVRPVSGLMDPVNGRATPRDHYGQTAAALALMLLDPPGSEAWRIAFAAWQAVPDASIGHDPFNRFLLGLLAEHMHLRGETGDALRDVSRAAGRCRLQRSYPSNNWTLLARLCELLEAEGRTRRSKSMRLRRLFDRWLTPAGGFIDYPARPGSTPYGATPIAYHHKALLVVVMAAEYSGDEAWQPYIEKLLGWSLQVWDGKGHVGGFGRSTHALFGDACLVASLLLLGAADAAVRETAPARMLQGVLQRWSGQFRADGLLGLNPADVRQPGSGWDGYMHLSVYNAWTAAIVGWARARAATIPRSETYLAQLRDPAPKPMAAQVDMLRLGRPEAMLALVGARGQPPQAFSRTEVELRYAGGTPFHMTWRGRVLCPAPIRVQREILRHNPALAGWTPLFEANGMLYGLTDFESFHREELGDSVRVTLHGQALALHRSPPVGSSARVLAGLDWRLLGGAIGRREALTRESLSGLYGTIILAISHIHPRITQKVRLDYRGEPPVTYLNPAGHAVTRAPLVNRDVQIDLPKRSTQANTGAEVWQECPMPSAIPDAIGLCLPAIIIGPAQEFRSRLQLVWQH